MDDSENIKSDTEHTEPVQIARNDDDDLLKSDDDDQDMFDQPVGPNFGIPPSPEKVKVDENAQNNDDKLDVTAQSVDVMDDQNDEKSSDKISDKISEHSEKPDSENSRRNSNESDDKPPLLPDNDEDLEKEYEKESEKNSEKPNSPVKREFSGIESDGSKSDHEKSKRKSKRARRGRSRSKSGSRSRSRSKSYSDSDGSDVSENRNSKSNDSDNQTVVLKVTNLPERPSQTSLKDGIFHEFKRHGKLESLAINEDRQTNERYALQGV